MHMLDEFSYARARVARASRNFASLERRHGAAATTEGRFRLDAAHDALLDAIDTYQHARPATVKQALRKLRDVRDCVSEDSADGSPEARRLVREAEAAFRAGAAGRALALLRQLSPLLDYELSDAAGHVHSIISGLSRPRLAVVN